MVKTKKKTFQSKNDLTNLHTQSVPFSCTAPSNAEYYFREDFCRVILMPMSEFPKKSFIA